MRVALYTSLKSDHDSIELLLNSLKNHTEVDSLTILNPDDLEITATENGVVFAFGNVMLHRRNFDFVVIRGGFTDVATTLELIRYCQSEGIRVFDNNLHKVRYLINKKADSIKLAQSGVRIPKTKFFSDVRELLKGELGWPVIIKPIGTGMGKNVSIAHTYEEALSVVDCLEYDIKKLVFQQFIDYEQDIRLFVFGDDVIAAMRRIPQEDDFRANFSLGGKVVVIEAPEEMKLLAISAAKACNLQMSGVDILVDKSGAYWVLEANRTPGLAGISQALGYNVADTIVERILGQ